jgi:hypothetical protein
MKKIIIGNIISNLIWLFTVSVTVIGVTLFALEKDKKNENLNK